MTVNPVTVPVMLEKGTATQLRRAARDIADAVARRDQWIVFAHEHGASLREIAEHAGVTHVAVMKIIRRSVERTNQP